MTGIIEIADRGIQLDLSVYKPVRISDSRKLVWEDVENRDNLLFAHDCPTRGFFARYVGVSDGRTMFEFRVGDSDQESELLSRSSPINLKRGIPASLKRDFEAALVSLEARAKEPDATDEARAFISSLRFANPVDCPELFRVVGKGKQAKLLVIWGCTRTNSSALVPMAAVSAIPLRSKSAFIGTCMAGFTLAALVMLLLFSPFPMDWSKLATNTSAEEPDLFQNASAPPYLMVTPTAVTSGVPIQVIPKAMGQLSIHSYGGKLNLERMTSGVDDSEALRVYLPGVRKVTFRPADERYEAEVVWFVVFEPPLVKDSLAGFKIPPGLDAKGAMISWGDGSPDTVVGDGESRFAHRYEQPGSFVVSFQPPASAAWAAIDFDVSIDFDNH